MLLERRFVVINVVDVVAVDVAVVVFVVVVAVVVVVFVVVVVVPPLPFLCAILVFVDWSGVFDEMLICLHLFSIFGVCVGLLFIGSVGWR